MSSKGSCYLEASNNLILIIPMVLVHVRAIALIESICSNLLLT